MIAICLLAGTCEHGVGISFANSETPVLWLLQVKPFGSGLLLKPVISEIHPLAQLLVRCQ